MIEYPTFPLATKWGTFTVTVFDPTPSAEERARNRHAQDGDLFSVRGEATINRVPVRVHAGFRRFPKRADDGRPTGEFWAQYQGYGIDRTDKAYGHEVPDGVRKVVREDIAGAALALITPAHERQARKVRLAQDAERLRGKAAEAQLQARNYLSDAEALELEAEAIEG